MGNAMWPDMRENVRAYLKGDFFKLGEGEWMIYRRMIKGKLTPQWSPTNDEAIGGEKFKYKQYLVHALVRPIGGEFGLVADFTNAQGVVPKAGYLAIVQHFIAHTTERPAIRPQISDFLFEIEGGNTRAKPKPPIQFRERYEILDTLKSRGDFGRAEAWILHVDIAANK